MKAWWQTLSPERLRHLYIAVLGGLTVITVMWMSSVGVLTRPHIMLAEAMGYPFFTRNTTHNRKRFSLSSLIDPDYETYMLNAVEEDDDDQQVVDPLTLEQKLERINDLGPNGVKFDISAVSHHQIINLTIQRLQLRVTDRLSRAGQYAIRLNQTTPITNDSLYVSHVIIDGGLGNWMFMVGSMFGVAQTNHRRPSLLKDYWAEKDFEAFSVEKKNRTNLLGSDSEALFQSSIIGEMAAGKFTPAMANLTAAKGPRNVTLAGYLQSWRYFDLYRDDVRSLFTFSREVFRSSLRAIEQQLTVYLKRTDEGKGKIEEQLSPILRTDERDGNVKEQLLQQEGTRKTNARNAEELLMPNRTKEWNGTIAEQLTTQKGTKERSRNIWEQLFSLNQGEQTTGKIKERFPTLKLKRTDRTNGQVKEQLPTLIGIHVRRGDITTEGQMKHGHRPATEEYLLRAALHFERTQSQVVFIVISNDIPYCRQLFKEPNFLFMENNAEAIDIAILSLMDRIILSVGTYGWWGAYLSDAKEVYYFRDWPRRGSDMQRLFNVEEFFLPSWTPFE
ncbi:hypothetical protein BV898_09170 [Hypsibius exemplaris]|uniref:L-Fucosyltransferase n=1 Tax=Hypsibius exemplaris TaxID=2072580 RepID=A0A1W0WN83_HYPEX|nr:hypothetical protein BV898_09170 [Hypsibius exemplaris]